MAKTINERLGSLSILDPETGNSIPVSLDLIQRYLLDEDNLMVIIGRARAAAAAKELADIEAGVDPTAAANELRANLDALDSVSETLFNRNRSIKNDETRRRTISDAARSFEDRTYSYAKPAVMRIGMIPLEDGLVKNGAQAIEVEDDYDIRRVGSLRSDTDAVVRGKSQHTEIRISLTFPDLDSVNTVFRPLLAQCRAAPVISIESDLLVDVLINKFATPELLNALLQVGAAKTKTDEDDPLEKLTEESRESLDKLKDLLSSGDSATMYAVARARQKATQEASKPNANPTVEQARPFDVPDYGIAIPVALREVHVSTKKSGTHALDATFIFVRINESAFMQSGLRWRDSNGWPTYDVTKCDTLYRYFHKTYLTPSDQKDSQTYMAPIPKSDAEVQAPMILRWENYHTGEEKSIDLSDFECVIHQMNVGWSNKLCMMPLIGQHNPAVQYLGTSNGVAKVQIITKDRQLVRTLHQLKDEQDEISRRHSALDRDDRIIIENGVLNMTGMREFVIQSLTTTTDPRSPELIYLNITFVESKYTLREREQVTLFQDHYDKDHLKALWRFMFKTMNEAMDKTLRRQEWSQTEREVMSTLFGSSFLYRNVTGAAVDFSAVRADIEKGTGFFGTRLESGRTPGEAYRLQDSFRKATAPDNGMPGILNNSVMAAAISHFITSGGTDSSRIRWLKNREREAEKSVEDPASWLSWVNFTRNNQVTRVKNELQEQDLTVIKYIFDWPTQADLNGARATMLAWLDELQTHEVGPEVDKGSSMLFRVFMLARDHLRLDAPAFKQQFWDSVLEVLSNRQSDAAVQGKKWLSEDLAQAQSLLIGVLASGVADRWEGFDQSRFLSQKKFKALDANGPDEPSDNYPDMYLPTYADLFSNPPLGLVLGLPIPVVQQVDASQAKYAPLRGQSRKGDPQALWINFAPRYKDLGKRPPFEVRAAFGKPEEASNAIARTINDRVEPGFFYWKGSWKDELGAVEKYRNQMEQIRDEAKSHIIQLDHSISADGALLEGSLRNMIDYLMGEEYPSANSGTVQVLSNRQQAKDLIRKLDRVNAEVPVINLIDSEGRLVAYLRHAPQSNDRGRTRHFELVSFKGGPLKIRNPFNNSVLDHDEMLKPGQIQEVVNQIKDDHFSMQRAYPTYRVYAIEEDREQLIYSDDFYGVNCVSSIEIHHSKRNASLAILRITNTSGQFENDQFLPFAEEGNYEVNADDEGERFFRRFRFRSGTLIQIRMGYTGKPTELDIVFSGRVVEVQHGPVIQLICQGHRTDLLQEIEYANTNKDPYRILEDCFKKIGNAPSLGRTVKMGHINRTMIRDFLGERAAKQVTWWGKLWRHEVNSHLRNVYVHSNSQVVGGWFDFIDRGITDQYLEGIGQKVVRFFNDVPGVELLIPDAAFPAWVVPLQPFWDMIQEMVRHRPGNIAYVVPWEQDGTLFFGKPTTPYLAENPPTAERRAYNRLDRVVRKLSLQDISAIILERFLTSRFYKNRPLLMDALSNRTKLREKNASVNSLAELDRLTFSCYGHMTSFSSPGLRDESLRGNNRLHSLDFTSEWDYLLKWNPGLVKLATSFFFGMEWQPVWPNGFEGDWKLCFRGLMPPLQAGGSKELSRSAEDWKSQWVDSDNSSLNAMRVPTSFLDTKAQANAMIRVLEKQQIELQAARDSINEMRSQGRIPARILDQLEEQVQERREVFEQFGVLTAEQRAAQIARVRDALGGFSLPGASGRPDHYEELGTIVEFRANHYRMFIHALANFVRDQIGGETTLGRQIRKEAVTKAMDDHRSYMLPPGWKQFRDYHVLTSENDIIENSITASMQQMHNVVLIRHPEAGVELVSGDELQEDSEVEDLNNTDGQLARKRVMFQEDTTWNSFPKDGGLPFRPALGKEHRKLLVKVENNAFDQESAFRCLISNMQQALQPMYRGYITFIGRHMKPHDVIHIKDDISDMIGPVEVDEITHHFTPEGGWVSSVVPHALVHANDIVSRVQHNAIVSWFGDAASWYEKNWWWIELGMLVAAPLTGGASVVGGAALRGLAKVGIKTGLRKGLRGTVARIGNRTLRQAMIKAITRKAVRSKTTVAGALNVMARNPHTLFGTIGRTMGMGVRTVNRLSIPAYLGAVGYNTFVSTPHIKAKFGDVEVPVEIQPLMLKGRPYTAGLEYGYEDVYSFWEKGRGWIKDVWSDTKEVAENLFRFRGYEPRSLGESLYNQSLKSD